MLLTLGCPVYQSNESTLRRSLDSVLAQTFADFELIITDNSPLEHSATEAICREYEARDPRVRYVRNEINLGAYPNFMRVFTLATGKYFKWIADDDAIDPTYLEKCIAVLEANDDVALCYTKVRVVDPQGNALPEDRGAQLSATEDYPVARITSVIDAAWNAQGVYGVFRTSMLRRRHPMSDDCVRLADILMLAEVSLFGKIVQLDETLFTYMQHEKDWEDREKLNASQYATCFPNVQQRGITFPNLLFAWELMQAVRYSDLSLADKTKLYQVLPAAVQARIDGYWAQEVRRAVNLVLSQLIFHNWGEPTDQAANGAALLTQYTAVYRFHASELLTRFEQVLHVWPTCPVPGLHTARAILLSLLNRMTEAKAVLHTELGKHPDFQPAQRLLANLEALTRQQAAV